MSGSQIILNTASTVLPDKRAANRVARRARQSGDAGISNAVKASCGNAQVENVSIAGHRRACLVQADDLISTIMHPLSDGRCFVSGQAVLVDGGVTICRERPA